MPKEKPKKPCPHYEDAQGLCHGCGILLNPALWADYLEIVRRHHGKKTS